jgi:allantoinase|tara:strand:- start:24 stop:923 length:900 start_codon:yes stop_codon:yes gene_type:complete
MNKRNFIGYGNNPPNPKWPNNSRIAVNFIINVEEGSEYSPLYGNENSETGLSEVPGGRHKKNKRDLGIESIYEYGPRSGFWRIVNIFDNYKIPVTYFTCAEALLHNNKITEYIKNSNNDICGHGYRWTEHYKMTKKIEEKNISKAYDLIYRLTNKKISGWYCRYAPSQNTRELLIKHGQFIYDSDAYNDDLPYWVKLKNKKHLVIPYALDTNDVQFKLAAGFGTAKQFTDYICDTFNFLYREGKDYPKMLSIGLHPRLIGRPGRALALEKIIKHIKSFKKVWICKREEIAHHWIKNFNE